MYRKQEALAAEGAGSWELDFGKKGWYLDGFGAGAHTIEGKLCWKGDGEIDVYVVDTVSNGRTDGGPPPWSPK